jgi:acetyltransferase-like isoleucine patch superfamily enzyme
MPRQIPGDWCEIGIPDNAVVHDTALIESSLSFEPYRSTADVGLVMDEGAGIYNGAVLDVGVSGTVKLGKCCLLTAGIIICDGRVELGDHCLVSWNVVIMDTYRASRDLHQRRIAMQQIINRSPRRLPENVVEAKPVKIGNNVWIGFDSIVLPGVTIGDGSIVGCRSVVSEDVPAYCVVAGNPARVVRQLSPLDPNHNPNRNRLMPDDSEPHSRKGL